MQVTLLYYDPNHTALGQPLEAGKRIVFGGGMRADLQVSGEGIADAHFAIENDGQSVWVHQLVDSLAPVLLNDKPIKKSEIGDGDTVAAGNTKVRVQIRNRDQKKTPVAQQFVDAISTSPMPVASKQSPRVVVQSLPTGLVVYRSPDGTTSVRGVIEILLTKYEPVVLANFRGIGVAPPESLLGADLLAAAPSDITDTNSLHLIFSGDLRAIDPKNNAFELPDLECKLLLDLFHQLRPKAGAILAFTKATKPDVAKAIGFRRGFYCSPDSLEMFLKQGSRELAHALVECFSAILIARAADDQWAIYASPEASTVGKDLDTMILPTTTVS